MRRFLLFLSLLLSIQLYAQVPDRYVKDEVNALSNTEKLSLNTSLYAFEQELGAQMVLVLLDTLPTGASALETATDIANQLDVGQPNVNNGLLLCLFLKEGKLSLVTGYGTQWLITNEEAQRILDDMSPQLRKGATAEALEGAIEAAKAEMAGQDWNAVAYASAKKLKVGDIVYLEQYEAVLTEPPLLMLADGKTLKLDLQAEHQQLLPRLGRGKVWLRISGLKPLEGQLLGVE